MPFIIAGVLLILFTANVIIGAVTDSPVVGIVAEWLILFAASIFFVIAILRREAEVKKNNTTNDQ
jgi:hypothetical protein